MDFQDYARKLRVVDVWKPGNPSGVVTDRRLYDPSVPGSMAPPAWGDRGPQGMLLHGTVGVDSLRYLAQGSVTDGRWVCAHYLLPKEPYTVYKLVPDGYACNHAGPSRWRGLADLNRHFLGLEIENRQDGQDPFTLDQYVKAALVWAYESARYHLSDLNLTTHAQVALHPDGHLGRRADPLPAGDFDLALFYGLLWDIRKPSGWPVLWGLPLWQGGR